MFTALKIAHATRDVKSGNIAIKMTEVKDDTLKCSVHDDKFFDDTLRTININTGKECLEIVTQMKGENSPAVLYCDDFHVTNEENHTDTFRLPACPPTEIKYAFSADSTQSAIVTVTAVYNMAENNGGGQKDFIEYEIRKAVIQIGESK